MNEPLGYSRDADTVTLRMTHDDYQNVILALGYAAGAAQDGGAFPVLFWRFIALANRINAGNAEYTPYEIPEALR